MTATAAADADLDRRERALEALLAKWTAPALALVRRKLADAEAHAVKALTDTLKRTPDGRATIRRAAQSPSYQAAQARLDELLDALAGPSRVSTDGLVRDAAEALYVAAWHAWKPWIPESLRAAEEPSKAQRLAARKLVVHGYDPRAELAGHVEGAGRRLLAVLAQAGQRTTAEHVASDLVATWRRQTEAGLGQVVTRVLSDWQKAADTQAGRDLVHPDYHDTSEIEP